MYSGTLFRGHHHKANPSGKATGQCKSKPKCVVFNP